MAINNNYNLGKNTYHSYGKYSQKNMNSSIIQGKLFNQYADKYDSVTKNKGGLLSKLTSGFGSIKEAMEGFVEPIQTSNDDLQRTTLITTYEAEMNKLQTEYSTMYNSFIENQSSLSDEERSNIEQELLSKKKRLELLAENIKNEMNTLLKSSELNDTTQTEGFQDFYIDQTTTHAKLETTKLRMTSNYYFYLVYFIIAVTLLSFTFNIMVNPNADVMNAIFVVGGIVIIFLISKMMS